MSRDDTRLEAIEAICYCLSQRSAVLFLGAGVNAGVLNPAGESFPLGQALSEWICRDLLGDPNVRLTLDEAVEMARFRLGEREVNTYLFNRFAEFRPGMAHLAVVQLPWDVIYTTNFDLLVEDAAKADTITPAGRVAAVFSGRTDLSPFSEGDILYYKLHGSIDYANTDEGRLILTREDYRHYSVHRKPLFQRLKRDLLGRTFLFVGYALQDPNFRTILEDCREVLDAKTLPLSYAVRQEFADVEAAFWREKYNIQLIDCDGAVFTNAVKEAWLAQGRAVVPFEERRSRGYVDVDPITRFEKVGESFYRVRAGDCTGASDAKRFFRGGEPTWPDIRDRVAPRREAYWTALDAIFPELVDPTSPPSVYLITGAAGTGKTTLTRSIVYALADEFGLPVLVHIPSTPLDHRAVSPLVQEKDLRRIVIVVNHAAECVREVEHFMEAVKQRRLPVTVILEERKNQWLVARTVTRTRLTPAEFELGALSGVEIEAVLMALERHEALGKLTGASWEYKLDHFAAVADKELLVALRELTTETTFDKIIRDEYERIPGEVGRQAYLYVAAVGQVDLALRYETLVHTLGVGYAELGAAVFQPTEGVLISAEAVGSSRHNAGFQVRTRHPIIASVIFAAAAPDDDAKFEVLNRLLTQLDPGYREDRRLLDELVRRRELVNTFASKDKRRAVYERLAAILPDDPHVLQHRSILERELGNPEYAVKYAREALHLNRNNPAFLNTLGAALEFSARVSEEPGIRQGLLGEAMRLFEDGVRRDPSNPYGYIGKVQVIRQQANSEARPDRKALLEASALSLLEEAYETTGESPIIAGELGAYRERFGRIEEAIAVFRAGLERDPSDSRLRDLWIRVEVDRERLREALEVATEGVRFDPTAWRLQRWIGRIKARLEHPPDAVRGHFEAAMRHRKGDVGLVVELGAYLFAKGRYAEARETFEEGKRLPVEGQERTRVREWLRDSDGREAMFVGRVATVRGAYGFLLAVPENFEVFFWRNRARLRDLRERDRVRFQVGFNALGAVARIVD